MANNNPPVKTGESHETLYRRASEGLAQLFGSSKGPGIFQQELPAGFKSRTQFVRSIMDADGNKAFFEALPQPHTNALAIVMAARGNPFYPPGLVVEFAARRPEEGDDEYDDTVSRIERLTLLAEITELTRDPTTGKSRVALKLPFNGHLDFRGAAVGIFDSLSPEEREKLGLNSLEGGFREFSSDPDEVVGELKSRTFTPMQRFYLRVQQWAEQREVARMERDRRRGGQYGRGEDITDAAAALPQATPATPEPPKAPTIPSLAALTGDEPTQPPAPPKAAPERKKAVVVPVTATAPTIAPPAEKPKPAAAVADEDRELILEAIKAAGTPAARAMLALVRGGKKTVAEAAVWATSKGLF